jgi:hypothetical protein
MSFLNLIIVAYMNTFVYQGRNKSMNRIKISGRSPIGAFILISAVIFLSSVNLGWGAADGGTFTRDASMFSYNFKNETLQEVCKTISRATGYEIRFDDHFADLPITAAFEETTAFGALKKVLRNHNHSLVINEEKHSIEVYLIPNGNLTTGERLAALPSKNQGGGSETYREELNRRMGDDDPVAAEAMEAYAREYIMQTATGEDPELVESADIDTYAEEYINRVKDNEPPPIAADSMEAYAQEYINQTAGGDGRESIEAADINTYAERYIENVTSKNDEMTPPIVAGDINEYAEEYIRRQHDTELMAE